SKRHALAQTSAKNLRHRHIPFLSENIETRKLERREHLRAIVVERCCRVRDQKSKLFQPRRIVSDQIRFHCTKRRFRRLTTATHLTQSDQTFITLDFNDRPHKATPVTAVRVTQRRLDRNSHSRRP